jgi:tRNA G10  N-methylase Trm11
VPKLFFLLSGENKSLPAAEIKAILETEGYTYANVEEFDQVLRLEAELECVKVVSIRSAYTRVCAQELFVSNAIISDIAKVVARTDFKSVLESGESFVVRINRIKNYADQAINTMRVPA